jgi:hypothetical protein
MTYVDNVLQHITVWMNHTVVTTVAMFPVFMNMPLPGIGLAGNPHPLSRQADG